MVLFYYLELCSCLSISREVITTPSIGLCLSSDKESHQRVDVHHDLGCSQR